MEDSFDIIQYQVKMLWHKPKSNTDLLPLLWTSRLKGDYLDFSNLTELKNIYVNEIYMKNQNKSSRIKSHRIKNIYIF